MGNLFKKNKIFTSIGSTSGGGGGATIDVVANYAALPSAASVSGEFRWVSASTGIHLTGLYYSNGVSWEFSPADDITVVADYNALPAANTVTGQFYWCSSAVTHTTLFITFTDYNSGLYYSNGTTWELIPIPIQATQVEVNAESITSKYVTPGTLGSWFIQKLFALTAKTSLVDADTVPITDSAASDIPKKITYANLKASLKTYFDTLYQTISTALLISNNLSDLNNKATARVNLQLDKITNGGNAAYSILTTDKVVYTGTAFTAARIWTLPDASTVNAGYEVIIADFLNTVTSTNTLTIAVQSGQKMDNVTNGTEVMQSAGGFRRFISDGSSNWCQDLGIVRLTKTQTLSNKDISRRVVSISSSATPALNTDNTDVLELTGLSTNITSFTTNLTGTPRNKQLLEIDITDNGTARTITWGASFAASGFLALPTTTAISTILRCGFEYNSTTSKWEIIAIA